MLRDSLILAIGTSALVGVVWFVLVHQPLLLSQPPAPLVNAAPHGATENGFVMQLAQFISTEYARHAEDNATDIKPNDVATCLSYLRKYPCCESPSAGHNCCGSRWNEHDRWRPMKLKSHPYIVEIGGNTGHDMSQLLSRFRPLQRYVVFEPIPQFAKELQRKFSSYTFVDIRNLGLGVQDAMVTFRIDGGSTSEIFSGGDGEKVTLRNATAQLEDIRIWQADLLHINCEGCEYAALEALIGAGWHKHLPVIQLGTHRLGMSAVEARIRYCAIYDTLYKTHLPEFWTPWGWERWVLRL